MKKIMAMVFAVVIAMMFVGAISTAAMTAQGPCASFHLARRIFAYSDNDTFISDIYERQVQYSPQIYNDDDNSNTSLGDLEFWVEAKNITYVSEKEHATWNKTAASWIFPPEYVINENVWFGVNFWGTNETETKVINVDMSREMNQTIFYNTGYQLANFTVIFRDKNFLWTWGSIFVHEHDKANISIMPGTFYSDAPSSLSYERPHQLNFNVDKDLLQLNIPYNFSVIFKVEPKTLPVLYKPYLSIDICLNHSALDGGEGNTVNIPPEILPANITHASASANISNNWTTNVYFETHAVLDEVVEVVEGWIKNPENGHYYKLTAPMNWLDAKAQAIEWDGHLVTLNNWEEESWIKTVFGETEYFWIGFNDIAEEGNWVWSSGETVTYTNWAEGEPNNCGGPPGECWPEDAAVMNWDGPAQWGEEPLYGDYWNDLPIPNSSLRGIVESGVEKPAVSVSISTDKFEYSPADTMTITIDIANPTSDPVTFEWYIGVPQRDIWVTYASAPISAGFDNTYTIPIPVGYWGPTPFGLVHYVHMLDPVSGDVLVQDVALCAYSPGVGEAMPRDIKEEIMKTIERVEFPN